MILPNRTHRYGRMKVRSRLENKMEWKRTDRKSMVMFKFAASHTNTQMQLQTCKHGRDFVTVLYWNSSYGICCVRHEADGFIGESIEIGGVWV